MKQLFAVVCLVLLALGAQTASASKILYFVDGNNGTDQMAAALAALPGSNAITTVSDPTTFTTDLTTGTYDLAIFSAQEAYGSNYSAGFAALTTFVSGGGKAIADTWFTPAASDLAGLGVTYSGDVNGPAMNLSAFNSGVTNPVSLSNTVPPYATFDTGLALNGAGCSIAATFSDPGNASGTDGQGAIAVGGGGCRAIVNGFLNDTAGAAGEQIYTNEIEGLLNLAPPSVPEPGSFTMIGLGITGLIGYARRLRNGVR